MPIITVNQQQAIAFIKNNCGISEIPLTDKSVTQTLKKEFLNPYVVGHFRAINYMSTNLLDKPQFPAEDIQKIKQHPYYAETALSWLRELHGCLTSPMVNHGLISPLDVATYRNKQRPTKFPCPQHTAIPKLMQKWLVSLSDFHDEIRIFRMYPQRMTQGDGITLSQKAADIGMALLLIQPFYECNGRLSRLVENICRLNWNLPWRIIEHSGSQEEIYKDDIARYYRNSFVKEYL